MSRIFRITRDLTEDDREGGADPSLHAGSVVHEYVGHTYGMVREPWIAVCHAPGGPFFALPRDAVERVDES